MRPLAQSLFGNVLSFRQTHVMRNVHPARKLRVRPRGDPSRPGAAARAVQNRAEPGSGALAGRDPPILRSPRNHASGRRPRAIRLSCMVLSPPAKARAMHFDLVDLNLFRHVVEAGSITHGAERAHLAVAAASTRIRHLEEALGAALLTRGRQGVTPTPAGRTLLAHARTMLAQAARLREDIAAYGGRLAGHVRLLSNTNALTEFLPEALSDFLAAHPQV